MIESWLKVETFLTNDSFDSDFVDYRLNFLIYNTCIIILLRLEVLEEIEDEENINQETESEENRKLNWKEFLRRYYYKYYEKWSILTISVFLGNNNEWLLTFIE